MPAWKPRARHTPHARTALPRLSFRPLRLCILYNGDSIQGRLSMLPFPRKQRGETLSQRSPSSRSRSSATPDSRRSRAFRFPRAQLHYLLAAHSRHVVPADLDECVYLSANEMASRSGERSAAQETMRTREELACTVDRPTRSI